MEGMKAKQVCGAHQWELPGQIKGDAPKQTTILTVM